MVFRDILGGVISIDNTQSLGNQEKEGLISFDLTINKIKNSHLKDDDSGSMLVWLQLGKQNRYHPA